LSRLSKGSININFKEIRCMGRPNMLLNLLPRSSGFSFENLSGDLICQLDS
jgi:hypothetical protein